MSQTVDVVSPYDGHLISKVPLADVQKVEDSLEQAYRLFKDPAQALPKYQRIDILEKAAQIMQDRVEELTKVAAEEGGKPYQDSRVEVERAIQGVKLAVQTLHHLAGEEIPMGVTPSSTNRLAFTMNEPIGVVVSVSAFNHPLNLIVHQTVPAIATGCPVIVKPAETTPLSCFKFVEILYEAGLPQQWCQAFLCTNENAQKLVTDDRVGYFSFIGSSKVGWFLHSKLAPGTRCALEHGGVAPVIFEADANIDEALPLLLKGSFYHAGQVCVSVQRIFAHESVVEELSQKLAKMAADLVVGDPLDPRTEVGPLITPREVNRVEQWVNEAKDEGAQILVGGKRITETTFEPTVILNPPVSSKVSTQEIFGPVVCVYSYQDRHQAIAQANSLPYAFQASVFTQNLEVALDTVKRLNATAVMVNDHTAFRVDWMPFGGRDASGIGMGGIPYTMKEMTREKLMVVKSAVL